jgi:hypothetical protein
LQILTEDWPVKKVLSAGEGAVITPKRPEIESTTVEILIWFPLYKRVFRRHRFVTKSFQKSAQGFGPHVEAYEKRVAGSMEGRWNIYKIPKTA